MLCHGSAACSLHPTPSQWGPAAAAQVSMHQWVPPVASFITRLPMDAFVMNTVTSGGFVDARALHCATSAGVIIQLDPVI